MSEGTKRGTPTEVTRVGTKVIRVDDEVYAALVALRRPGERNFIAAIERVITEYESEVPPPDDDESSAA